jgi:uncharacterized protein DUF4349
MSSSRFRLWLPAVLLSGVVGLVGCTQFQSSVGSAPADGGAPEVGRAGDGAVPAATAAPDAGPTAERQIVRTGALSLRCDDLTVAADRLRVVAESMDGFVSSESIRVTGDSAEATSRIVVSVPAASMERFMAEAAKLGELVTRSVTARDVTEQVVDVEARIRTLRDSISRVRALMDKAGSITEIARVEEELTNRQSELESLLARQKALKNQVERAPVTVTLLRPGQADPQNPFLTGLIRGWEALQNSIAVLLTVLGGVLPFALIGAAIAWPLLRRYRRRTATPTSAAGAGRPDTDATDSAAPATAAATSPASGTPEADTDQGASGSS